jgi:hypothetical protein
VMQFIAMCKPPTPAPPTPAKLSDIINAGGAWTGVIVNRAIREGSNYTIRPRSTEGILLHETLLAEAANVSEADTATFMAMCQ